MPKNILQDNDKTPQNKPDQQNITAKNFEDKTLKITELETKAMQTAIVAGSLMISSGAESYRSEDTMSVILSLADQDNASYALGTGLIASLNTESGLPLTLTKRIKERSINLNIIDKVNQITRDLITNSINFDEAHKLLANINSNIYSNIQKVISTLGMTACYALLLSGSFIDALGGFIDGILLVLVNFIANRYSLRPFITNLMAGFLLSIGAILIGTWFLPNANQDMIIARAYAPLPGTSFTTALRDTIYGDFLSAITKAIEVFIVALALSIGVGLGLAFCVSTGIGTAHIGGL